MKLQVIHINSENGSEPYLDMFVSTLDRIKREDTEILPHRWAKLRRATDVVYAYPYLLNGVAIINEVVATAEAGDADGVMIACTGDPGLVESRTLVDIPVVGPWEATLHLAATYGYKFGVITVQERGWQEYCHSLVVRYGLESHCAGVVGIDLSSYEAFSKGFTDPGFVVAEVAKQAKRLVGMGASAIAIGSAGLGTIIAHEGLTRVPGEDDVPIFDALTVGLKTLEMRVDLAQKAGLPVMGRTGLYTRFADADAARVRYQTGFSA
jgi:allantoin racemase